MSSSLIPGILFQKELMTIQRAIELLIEMKNKHGDVEVMFDCQYCGKSTRPEIIVAVAMVQRSPTR